MFPGMNVNSAQMKQAMKRMGIAQEELDAQKVTIDLGDRELVFDAPSVSRVTMQGQETFQLAGDYVERVKDTTPDINDADVETVMAQTGKGKAEALAAIKAAKGDLAQAILALSE